MFDLLNQMDFINQEKNLFLVTDQGRRGISEFGFESADRQKNSLGDQRGRCFFKAQRIDH